MRKLLASVTFAFGDQQILGLLLLLDSSRVVGLVYIYYYDRHRRLHHRHYDLYFTLLLEIRSVERDICPIATFTMNKLFL